MSQDDQKIEDLNISVDYKYYYYLMKTNLHWLLLVTLLGVGIGYAVSLFVPPMYETSSTLLVTTPLSSNNQAEWFSVNTAEKLTRTYAELLTSPNVLNRANQMLDTPVAPSLLARSVTTEPIIATQLIRVIVENGDPLVATDIANAMSLALIDEINELQTSGFTSSQTNLEDQLIYLEEKIDEVTLIISDLEGTTDPDQIANRDRQNILLAQYNQDYTSLLQNYEDVRLRSVESNSHIYQTHPAVVPAAPFEPDPILYSVLGGSIGLLLLLAVFMVRSFLDDTLKTPSGLTRRFSYPIIGQILRFDLPDDKRLITSINPRSPSAESFRSLRVNLRYSSVDNHLSTLLITSPSPGDGKSTMSANLATVFAQGGQKVVLIDADMRRPTVHKTFNATALEGLSHLFISDGQTSIRDVMQSTSEKGLSLVTSGPLPPNPSVLLDTHRARSILEEAQSLSDLVIVDAPPINGMSDALAISQYVDGVILVVKAGSTRMGAIKKATEQLELVGANFLGFVVNDIHKTDKGYYYEYAYSEYDSYFEENGQVNSSTALNGDRPAPALSAGQNGSVKGEAIKS